MAFGMTGPNIILYLYQQKNITIFIPDRRRYVM